MVAGVDGVQPWSAKRSARHPPSRGIDSRARLDGTLSLTQKADDRPFSSLSRPVDRNAGPEKAPERLGLEIRSGD